MEPGLIAVYGSGGFGRETAWFLDTCGEGGVLYKVVCFIDDNPEKHGRIINDIPVMSLGESYNRFPSAKVVCAIGDPKTRKATVEKAAKQGFDFETVIHPMACFSKWVEIGHGTVIYFGNFFSVNIKIGRHVQINVKCNIGHDVIVGDFTTLAFGVNVSGWVHIGKNVYIGVGANIINGTEENPLVIGDNAIIGAGACVVKSVPANATVVGVPAKQIK